ncbi:MAG: hydrogenase maturation nickel metallochaperone HypA [Chitinophagales bacterium]
MHEVALIQNVLDIITQSTQEMHMERVSKIKLVVGKLSMALPDSLSFAFEVLKDGPLFGNAVLEIEERDIRCCCKECQTEFSPGNEYRFSCPECGSAGIEITSGRELFIDNYEGE